MMISLSRLETILARIPKLTIGLVGDVFLDRYLELAPGVHELSIETQLEAYQVAQVRNSPGAMGTVMNNLAALGVGLLKPVTVIGDDGHGYDLRKELSRLPVDFEAVVSDAQRLTPTYTKPLRLTHGGQWEELNRLDVRSREPLSGATTRRVCEALVAVWAACDGLIVLDQVNETNWGVVSSEVRHCLATLAGKQPERLMFVDSRAHLGDFNFGVLKGNRDEILGAGGMTSKGDRLVRDSARILANRTGRAVFCTMGEQGILVARPSGEPEMVAGCPVSGPVDIVGAGDAATSGMVTALLSGADELEASFFGNLVASITVQQLGTTGTASPQQVRARWHELSVR